MCADPYPGWSPNTFHPPGHDKDKSYWSEYHTSFRKQDYYGEREGNPFQDYYDQYIHKEDEEYASESCWDILEIKKTFDESVIRKAYHTLALIYHPDKGGTEKEFRKINEAYEIALLSI